MRQPAKLDSLHASISEGACRGDLTTLGTIIGNNPEALAAAIGARGRGEAWSTVANFGFPDGTLYSILALGRVVLMVVSRARTSRITSSGYSQSGSLRATLTAAVGLAAGTWDAT